MCAAVVQVVLTVIGFLTLWVKIKYGVDKAEEAATNAKVVEGKIDNNTAITTKAKNAAEAAEKQTNGTMSRYESQMSDHHNRISELENQMAAVKVSLDSVTSNVNSTRHEMRGHLQGIASKLDLMALSSVSHQKKESE